jgi:hypothetical protein
VDVSAETLLRRAFPPGATSVGPDVGSEAGDVWLIQASQPPTVPLGEHFRGSLEGVVDGLQNEGYSDVLKRAVIQVPGISWCFVLMED